MLLLRLLRGVGRWARLASWAAAVSLSPKLVDRSGYGLLVLSPWVPMLAQALGDSVSGKSFGIGYRCVLQEKTERFEYRFLPISELRYLTKSQA